MGGQNGGNTIPRITRAEHIGPNDTGDNIEAKRVAEYVWNGTDWERSTGGKASTQVYADFRFDPNDSAPTYIGKNKTNGAATSANDWTIYKFTYSGSDVTRIQKTTDAWDDRVAAF